MDFTWRWLGFNIFCWWRVLFINYSVNENNNNDKNNENSDMLMWNKEYKDLWHIKVYIIIYRLILIMVQFII